MSNGWKAVKGSDGYWYVYHNGRLITSYKHYVKAERYINAMVG